MAHLNSAEGIQNMCATQIMTKVSLENGFLKPGGALDQGLISCFQNASQTLISSRPNPTKKTGGKSRSTPGRMTPIPSHSRVVVFFFFW